MTGTTIPARFIERFWSRVDKSGPTMFDDLGACWIWTASKTSAGYGNIRLQSANEYAHRLSWIIANGHDVPADRQIAHLCGRRDCVNPAHLVVATQAENEAHKAIHGTQRHAIGARCATTKLTEEQVREIRRRVAAGNESMRAIGRAFGVTHTTIGAMLRGRTWAHLV